MVLSGALGRVENLRPEATAVVKLRFLTGFPVDEAANAIGASLRTARRSG